MRTTATKHLKCNDDGHGTDNGNCQDDDYHNDDDYNHHSKRPDD